MKEVILSLKNISKRYPGVQALENVSLDVEKGEVHVIVGENGAGKSTLVKIVTGAVQSDGGEIALNGQTVEGLNPHRARGLGINCIYQEFNLLENLSIAENIFLGEEPSFGGPFSIVDRRKMIAGASALLPGLGLDLDPRIKVCELGVAERQVVEILKALVIESRLLILDEPTSALSKKEAQNLFNVIAELKSNGIAIIYITHYLSEVFQLGDRFTVLKDGRVAGEGKVGGVTEEELVNMMVGKKLSLQIARRKVNAGKELLRVEGLSARGGFKEISFSLREGEILGIAGLVGARRTDLARALFGAGRIDSGTVEIRGKLMHIRSPYHAIKQGIGLLPEDRKREGLVLGMDVGDNICLATLRDVSRAGIVSRRSFMKKVSDSIKRLSIRTAGITQKARNLSGGNQQKVVLAKWLLSNAQIFIFDEPTRGIDVGTKAEIYRLMNDLTERGAAIIMISSELPEVLGMSDRIIVMHKGEITGTFERGEATEENVMRCAFGTKKM